MEQDRKQTQEQQFGPKHPDRRDDDQHERKQEERRPDHCLTGVTLHELVVFQVGCQDNDRHDWREGIADGRDEPLL